MVTADDWLYIIEQQLPWKRVLVRGLIAKEDAAALFFEGLDPVTGLSHRLAWWIEGRDGLITSLLEISQIVENLSEECDDPPAG
jgi:hypothetical protein